MYLVWLGLFVCGTVAGGNALVLVVYVEKVGSCKEAGRVEGPTDTGSISRGELLHIG